MRLLSLHGLSQDAWDRYSGKGSWDYRIIAPGYKYNMTDIAAAIGIHQLARAEEMRRAREAIARGVLAAAGRRRGDRVARRLDADRIHAWHLFPIRLRLETLTIDRRQLHPANWTRRECRVRCTGVRCTSIPYYEQTFGWRPADLPVASAEWTRLVSLPLFSSMRPTMRSIPLSTPCGTCAADSHPGRRLAPTA